MLTYILGQKGNMPLYQELYTRIKEDIRCGRLAADVRLPSKRRFAEHLEVSKVTVENAYQQLAAEGYIYSVEKKGYFVSRIGAQASPVQAAPQPLLYSADHEPVVYDVDLITNNISAEQFPFSVWSKLMRKVILDYNTTLLNHVHHQGARQLRMAICSYLRSNRGLLVQPEQVVVGAGTEYLYTLLIQLLGRERCYAIENPGYGKIAKIYASNGVSCRHVDLDIDGVSVAQLRESGADILHVSPSHHFPTGVVTPVRRRQELLAWAEESPERYIIEDDYDSEFRFVGRPIPTLSSIDQGGRVIYVNTFSKTIAPAMRISYMILPPALLERFQQKLAFYSCTVPAFEQYTLAAFMDGGWFERHINRMKSFYRTRRNEIIQTIRCSPYGEQMTIIEQDAGLHFLVRVHTERTDAELKELCSRAGIRVSCMADYDSRPNSRSEHCFVVNYSGADAEKLRAAFERLEPLLLETDREEIEK